MRLTYLDTLKDAWPEPAGRRGRPEALVPAFRRRIADARQKEMWNGVSLVGPQRDDLRVALARARRGHPRQPRAAAHDHRGPEAGRDGTCWAPRARPRPIVLLDDVFSELDRDRAERTLDLLLERGQVLVTTADLATAARRPAPARAGLAGGRGELRRSPRVA